MPKVINRRFMSFESQREKPTMWIDTNQAVQALKMAIEAGNFGFRK